MITYMFAFGIHIPKKLHVSYINRLSAITCPKVALHVFFCDSESYMEKMFRNYCLQNLISVTQNNVFGISSVIISGWSVVANFTRKFQRKKNRAHLKGGNGKGSIRICLPVHCLSARSDRQPYRHTNATSSPR